MIIINGVLNIDIINDFKKAHENSSSIEEYTRLYDDICTKYNICNILELRELFPC